MAAALDQIAGWQVAKKKIPAWAATEGIIYPAHLSLEQCSSEVTARYKANLVRRLLASLGNVKNTCFVDFTGGFGVDFCFIAPCFDEAVYVECQPLLFHIATSNFRTLGLKVKAVNDNAADVLHRQDHATLMFLDPARRNVHGGRTFGIADCAPNVLGMMDELMAKADYLLLKLSPMLDWRKAVSDVGESLVEQVHIVSVGGECKELLLLLTAQRRKTTLLFCVNDNTTECFDLTDSVPTTLAMTIQPQPGSYLYEPNASLMKAGLFERLSARYGLSQVAANSHLFVSNSLVQPFPGRTFRITEVSTLNKHEVKAKILPLRQANIAVRNFPLTVNELRRRLKLGEGGGNYIFATTLANRDKVLIVGLRLS